MDPERIIAINKDDLFQAKEIPADLAGEKVVVVSAKTGHHPDVLEEAIISPFEGDVSAAQGFIVSHVRHHDLLEKTAEEIDASIALLEEGISRGNRPRRPPQRDSLSRRNHRRNHHREHANTCLFNILYRK